MSEYDDNTNEQEEHVHIHLSGVAFHVLCVGLGFHVVIGVGRLVVLFHHVYVIPKFLLDVVVRLYLVIVNSDCIHNYCMLHIAKTVPLRCRPYKHTRAKRVDSSKSSTKIPKAELHVTSVQRAH